MTSRIGTIQTRLRTVVNDLLATTVEWRAMTSAYGIEPRTYSTSWTSVGAVVTKKTHRSEFDERRGEYARAERIQIRTDDSFARKQGDQFRLAASNDQIWNVDERISSGTGSYLYVCVRSIPTLVSGGDRGGGV